MPLIHERVAAFNIIHADEGKNRTTNLPLQGLTGQCSYQGTLIIAMNSVYVCV